MKHTIDKVDEYIIYVFAVFISVCKKTGSELTQLYDQ